MNVYPRVKSYIIHSIWISIQYIRLNKFKIMSKFIYFKLGGYSVISIRIPISLYFSYKGRYMIIYRNPTTSDIDTPITFIVLSE